MNGPYRESSKCTAAFIINQLLRNKTGTESTSSDQPELCILLSVPTTFNNQNKVRSKKSITILKKYEPKLK